jgi:c-di-GMP-binding flagellar brake protein YcgR
MAETGSFDPGQWRPAPGQIALIEPVGASRERDCLTGVVVPGELIAVDLGASPRPEAEVTEVVASIFAPDALYRLFAKATQKGDGLLVLDVSAMERVQRRAARRAQVALPVRLGVGEAVEAALLSGETLDVSTGGCRVTTDRPWPTDCEPVLTIDMPDGGRVVTSARVVTVDLTRSGWEYRLAFPGIADFERERLSRLVSLDD